MSYTNYENLDPGVIIFAVVIALISYAITAWFTGEIFAKAGLEKWKAWVPVYNNWVFLELGGQKGWYILLGLLSAIPLVGFVASIFLIVVLCMAAYNIGNNFNKPSFWWVVLYFFLPVIWLGILAFDGSRWMGIRHTAKPSPSF